ncbi:hypothetical protein E2C01_098441 [Portunus trituberculatus]|uniref:Uncharacterized protein n=1 Tax=Portunus trituberculatus TaxID=210409 RepID=A0A5B7K7N6_PORTR|nr:hypothetical protein [Portunus trituberculatus]
MSTVEGRDETSFGYVYGDSRYLSGERGAGGRNGQKIYMKVPGGDEQR